MDRTAISAQQFGIDILFFLLSLKNIIFCSRFSPCPEIHKPLEPKQEMINYNKKKKSNSVPLVTGKTHSLYHFFTKLNSEYLILVIALNEMEQ